MTTLPPTVNPLTLALLRTMTPPLFTVTLLPVLTKTEPPALTSRLVAVPPVFTTTVTPLFTSKSLRAGPATLNAEPFFVPSAMVLGATVSSTFAPSVAVIPVAVPPLRTSMLPPSAIEALAAMPPWPRVSLPVSLTTGALMVSPLTIVRSRSQLPLVLSVTP